MLYHDDEFLQILEGEKETVNDLYSAIVKDKRHSNVHLIIVNEKRKRIFPDWSMAYYNIKDNDLLKFDSLSEFINKSSLAVDLFCEMYLQILSADRKF